MARHQRLNAVCQLQENTGEVAHAYLGMRKFSPAGSDLVRYILDSVSHASEVFMKAAAGILALTLITLVIGACEQDAVEAPPEDSVGGSGSNEPTTASQSIAKIEAHSSYGAASLCELVASAPVGVGVYIVEELTSSWHRGDSSTVANSMRTAAQLVAEDVWAGDAPNSFVFTQPGGEGDGVTVTGHTSLAAGERVVLFIQVDRDERNDGTYWIWERQILREVEAGVFGGGGLGSCTTVHEQELYRLVLDAYDAHSEAGFSTDSDRGVCPTDVEPQEFCDVGEDPDDPPEE